MIIDGVDPRDILWESDSPVYRVYFWHQPPAPAGVKQENVGWHCEEYRLSHAMDVEQVLAWARDRARDKARPEQTFVTCVEGRDAGRRGLVRLQGKDPLSST